MEFPPKRDALLFCCPMLVHWKIRSLENQYKIYAGVLWVRAIRHGFIISVGYKAAWDLHLQYVSFFSQLFSKITSFWLVYIPPPTLSVMVGTQRGGRSYKDEGKWRANTVLLWRLLHPRSLTTSNGSCSPEGSRGGEDKKRKKEIQWATFPGSS